MLHVVAFSLLIMHDVHNDRTVLHSLILLTVQCIYQARTCTRNLRICVNFDSLTTMNFFLIYLDVITKGKV